MQDARDRYLEEISGFGCAHEKFNFFQVVINGCQGVEAVFLS
jgi:hypothetical protein